MGSGAICGYAYLDVCSPFTHPTAPVFWNVITVIYFVREIRRGTLSALKFSIIFVFSLGITIALILFIAVTVSDGFDPIAIGIILIVFLIHAVVVFPTVYFISRLVMPGLLKKLSQWQSRKD